MDCLSTTATTNMADTILAYITPQTILNIRKKRTHPSRGNRPNRRTTALSLRKLSNLQEADTAEDPYIVAILIALAQERRQNMSHMPQDLGIMSFQAPYVPLFSRQSASSPSRLTNRQVSAFSMPDPEPSVLYFYQVTIPSTFLDKFERPSCRSRSGPV